VGVCWRVFGYGREELVQVSKWWLLEVAEMVAMESFCLVKF